MKGKLRAAAALALGISLMTVGVSAAGTTFSDVPKTHWAYDYVTRASDQGLVSGMGNGRYGVNEKLSNAQFAVMITNLFYKDAVSTNKNNYEWWRPYMDTAYAKGVLSNTTVGSQRSSSGSWTASLVNAEINRYDMAQIMMNLAKDQDWSSPTATELALAITKISDWKSIPTKYQTTVATAYAKGYLSGMDNGAFRGSSSMDRAQAAAVLCKLLEEKNKIDAPVYTNTTNLVNGKSATEKNVTSALEALKASYPQGSDWNTSRTYTSAKLGSGTGSQAFAYMLSDKVFGGMKATEQTKPSRLKAGDVVYFHSDKQYAVVLEVSGGEFSYVTCSASGMVTWRGSGDVDDLGSRDTIYTRYDASSSDELANGKSITEKNVYNALMDLKDDYDQGDTWDMEERYRSDAFGSVYGSEAFAGFLSDEVFGDLEVRSHTKHADIKVGDVLYLSEYEEYVVVVEIDQDELTCAGVNARGRILWNDTQYVDDLVKKDVVYTRYPEKAGSSSDELANGKTATEKNVRSALLDVKDDYDRGDIWDMDKRYRSDVLGSGYGSEAFAYFVSDEVFGELEVSTHTKHEDLRPGDVVYLYDSDEYVVVVDFDGQEFTCAGVTSRGKIYWDDSWDIDDLGKKDTVYTRYPDGSSGSDTLANGKAATEKNAYNALMKVEKSYPKGDIWDLDMRYRSKELGTVRGSEAFAYFLSDQVFGDLSVEKHTKHADLKVGDILYLSDYEEYVVVVDFDGDEVTYAGVNTKGKIYWDNYLDVDDLGKKDFIYTRYPD